VDVITSLLTLSVALSGLSYALGVLLYALPLPIRGVKRWAPILISDAQLVLVMSLAYGSIIYFSDWVIEATTSTSREELVHEIYEIANGIARLYLFFKLLKIMFSSVFSLNVFGLPLGKALNVFYEVVSALDPLGNWASSFTLDLLIMVFKAGAYLWTFTYILAVVGELVMPVMLALGTLALGVPFRLTKSVGAALIGFAISTYVFVPLVVSLLRLIASYNPALKVVTELILNLPVRASTGVAYPYGKVEDARGEPVVHAFIYFEDRNGRFGLYPLDGEGRFDTRIPLGGAPWPRAFVKVDLYGLVVNYGWVRFGSMDKGSFGEVTIKMGKVWAFSPGVAVVGDVLAEFKPSVDPQAGTLYLQFKLTALRDTEVHIVATGVLKDRVSFVSSHNLANSRINMDSWEGMPSYIISFRMSSGERVEIVVYGTVGTFTPPKPHVLGYLASLMGIRMKNTISYVRHHASQQYLLVVPFIVSALPAIHIVLTGLVARAIASLISEGSKSLVVRMW